MKKRNTGKHHLTVIGTLAHKLTNIIFTIIRPFIVVKVIENFLLFNVLIVL